MGFLKVFNDGIAKYPQTALLYFNKGIALLGQNRFPDAELLFQQSLLVNPYLYSAHYQLALSAYSKANLYPRF